MKTIDDLYNEIEDANIDLAIYKRNINIVKQFLKDAITALDKNKTHITKDHIERSLNLLERLK